MLTADGSLVLEAQELTTVEYVAHHLFAFGEYADCTKSLGFVGVLPSKGRFEEQSYPTTDRFGQPIIGKRDVLVADPHSRHRIVNGFVPSEPVVEYARVEEADPNHISVSLRIAIPNGKTLGDFEKSFKSFSR